MARSDVTKKYLRKIFSYDKEHGVLIWKKRNDRTGQWNGRWAGKAAGSIIVRNNRDLPYSAISIDDNKYSTRHLVWVYHNGGYPDNLRVTSIDGDPMDCRIENLMLADNTDIQRVRPEWSSRNGKYKGVYRKGNRFKAEITKNKKREYLGLFKTAEDAARAYNRAAVRLYGEGCYLNQVPGVDEEDVF